MDVKANPIAQGVSVSTGNMIVPLKTDDNTNMKWIPAYGMIDLNNMTDRDLEAARRFMWFQGTLPGRLTVFLMSVMETDNVSK